MRKLLIVVLLVVLIASPVGAQSGGGSQKGEIASGYATQSEEVATVKGVEDNCNSSLCQLSNQQLVYVGIALGAGSVALAHFVWHQRLVLQYQHQDQDN